MMRKIGDWKKYGDILERGASETLKTLDRSVAKQAAILATNVKKNIRSGGSLAGKPFRPLDPQTIARKGSSKPLIDTGAGLRSVKSQKKSEAVYFVGIPGNMRSNDGTSVALYMAAHEFGAVDANGKFSEPRPWLGPVIDKTKKKMLKQIELDMGKLFR